MTEQRFPWIAIAVVGCVALVAMTLSRSDSGREALEPEPSAPPGETAATLLPGDPGGSPSRPMGSETASSAESARRDLRVVPRAVKLNATAEQLVRTVEPRIQEFEASARAADLPDERGTQDREFIEMEELEHAEEALDLVELEQELRGAERSALMFNRLDAALKQH